ncbi:MAG: DUF1464 family protein [Candidatus Helarchaeota archaeon]
MVKVIGIDPGTNLWGIVGLEGTNIIYENSFPTKRVINHPELLIDILDSINNIDLIVAPSGFGIPLTAINNLTKEQIFEMTLKIQKNNSEIVGLEKVINLLIKKDYNTYFIPGVKHLLTVPKYRKINKLDMGTADKVCAAALAIYDQSRTLNKEYSDTNLILVELGSGFTAIIGISNGKIVDGIGGTSGGLGFMCGGALDGELAYYLKNIKKSTIYKGGITSIVGSQISPEEFVLLIDKDERSKLAFDAFIEDIQKNIMAMTISVGKVDEILLSGRLSYQEKIINTLKEVLKDVAPIRKVNLLPGSKFTKEAAQGAALIANGIANGEFKPLTQCMQIQEASGSILDYIYYD